LLLQVGGTIKPAGEPVWAVPDSQWQRAHDIGAYGMSTPNPSHDGVCQAHSAGHYATESITTPDIHCQCNDPMKKTAAKSLAGLHDLAKKFWWRFTDSNRGPVDYDDILIAKFSQNP